MLKLENLGRVLSKLEQSKIAGGAGCSTYGQYCHPGLQACCPGTVCRLYQAPFGYNCQW